MYEVVVETHFNAAHALAGHPGKCSRMHGHTYAVRVAVRGEALDQIGMLIDFSVLRQLVAELLEQYDHRDLGELEQYGPTRNPTSENIAADLHADLSRRLAELPEAAGRGLTVAWVEVRESPGGAAVYYGSP